MIKTGEYNLLKVMKEKPMGVFLDDGGEGILLPKRFVPQGARVGDLLKVFIYHDGEDRLIATTLQPKAAVGDIAKLEVVNVTAHGAFLNNGLMKDLFIPRANQVSFMRVRGEYLVRVYIDERTGRMTATEKIDRYLSNEDLTVKEKDIVELFIYRQTDLGYAVIINNIHTGLIYHNEIFRDIVPGDRMEGFIKRILPENKIDAAIGKPGYERVEDETEKILRLLRANAGYLPYYDKSAPEDIYNFFGMSKKTFKMVTGNLYKKKQISFTQTGIQLIDTPDTATV